MNGMNCQKELTPASISPSVISNTILTPSEVAFGLHLDGSSSSLASSRYTGHVLLCSPFGHLHYLMWTYVVYSTWLISRVMFAMMLGRSCTCKSWGCVITPSYDADVYMCPLTQKHAYTQSKTRTHTHKYTNTKIQIHTHMFYPQMYAINVGITYINIQHRYMKREKGVTLPVTLALRKEKYDFLL